MRAVVLAPDSFKGSLSAPEVAEALARGLRRVWPGVQVRSRPMADGGEGTLEAVLAAAGGERRSCQVSDAAGRPLEAAWGLLHQPDGPAAVLEAAQVVGLTLAQAAPVAERSTRGLGEQVRHCLDQGIRRFLIGLGGSASNDGGSGVLAALGVRLTDADGRELTATPAGLAELAQVDFTGLDPRLAEARITLLADVRNPLCGASGATAVFGPQKGVMPDQVTEFDARLRRLADLCDAWRGEPVSQRPGAGAAGGLGYAFQLLGAESRAGAEVVAELAGLDDALHGADWVITGEGRSDGQTPFGKVPGMVARHARRAGVPVTLLSGAVAEADLAALEGEFDGCFAIAPGPLDAAECIARAAPLLADRMAQLARLADVLGKTSTKE